jgi:EpsD family peptidyl-prolyl cis-trans isomerase
VLFLSFGVLRKLKKYNHLRENDMSILKPSLVLLLIASALTLTACGNKDKEKTETSKASTQVVAKVNGDEISIHQINFQLGRLTQQNQAQMNEAQNKEAAKQILTRLVDQQLLIQKAVESKLDRDPRVLQALEASKNEILAQAYLEQLMTKAEKPSSAKIDTFYKENPELFEKRRVFRLQELIVDVDQAKHAEIEANIKSMKGINDIANYLKSKNYPFNANSNVRAAEQLPLALLKKIQPLKDGEFVAIPSGKALNIVHLAASQSKPIDRDKAAPIIEQYFMNQNKATLAKVEMADLNKKAKVEFVGAFADMKKDVVENAATKITKPEANIQAPSEASPSITSDKTAETQAAETTKKPIADPTNMDKGLSGL